MLQLNTSSCKSAVPTPDCDASHWKVTSLAQGRIGYIVVLQDRMTCDHCFYLVKCFLLVFVLVPLNVFRLAEMLGKIWEDNSPFSGIPLLRVHPFLFAYSGQLQHFWDQS